MPVSGLRLSLWATGACVLVLALGACGPRGEEVTLMPTSTADGSQVAAETPAETATTAFVPTASSTPLVSQPPANLPPTYTPVPATATQIQLTGTPTSRPTATRRPIVPSATVAVPTETPKPLWISRLLRNAC